MINTQPTICLAPGCGRSINQVAGHRKRLYCDDLCRQRAHRAKKQQQTGNITNDAAQARIAELEQKLGQSNALVEKLLASKKTREPLKKSYQERLQRLGEKLDFPALDIHIRVPPGKKNWRVFMLNESNDQLIRAIIAAERVEEKQP